MEPVETELPGLWVVSHGCFSTDDIRPTTTLVVADTKEEAVGKFNTLAAKRLEYPYMWSFVTPDSVRPAEVIV